MSSPNTHLSLDDFDDLMDRYKAAKACGDIAAMREVASHIKLSPGMALAGLQNEGKQKFLSYGFDLSYANSQLGEGWLESYGE